MGKVVDQESDVGTTFSKNSIATTTQQTMDEGDKVTYDPPGNSYPKGTLPALSKDWGDKSDKDLNSGFGLKTAYADPGEGPKDVKF